MVLLKPALMILCHNLKALSKVFYLTSLELQPPPPIDPKVLQSILRDIKMLVRCAQSSIVTCILTTPCEV